MVNKLFIMPIFILVFLSLIMAFFSSKVAEEKGYNKDFWFISGFLFSFIALIAASGLPDKRLRKYLRQIGEKQNAIDPENEYDDFGDVQKEVNKINKIR